MRPRFSLRWMLIAFTLLTVVFYVCFVRPTVLAKRFVAAIERGDYQAADAMCLGSDDDFVSNTYDSTVKPVTVTVTITPRSWSNVWKLNRLIEVKMIQNTESRTTSGQPDWLALRFRAVVGVFGIRPSEVVAYAISAAPKPKSSK